MARFPLRNNEAEATDLRTLTDVIWHGGLDDEGICADDVCGIGKRRLRIADLSTEHPPICDEDGSVAVVFNREIYNYQELRKDIIQRRHQFCTDSDTEIS